MSSFLRGACPRARGSRPITTVWKSKVFCSAFPDSKFRTNVFVWFEYFGPWKYQILLFPFPPAFHVQRYCSQVSQHTSPGIRGTDGRGSWAHPAPGIPLAGPSVADACQRGPPAAKEEVNRISDLNSTIRAKDQLQGYAREDHWEPTAGQTTHGTDGQSCKRPAEIAARGDGTDAQKDAVVLSFVLG